MPAGLAQQPVKKPAAEPAAAGGRRHRHRLNVGLCPGHQDAGVADQPATIACRCVATAFRCGPAPTRRLRDSRRWHRTARPPAPPPPRRPTTASVAGSPGERSPGDSLPRARLLGIRTAQIERLRCEHLAAPSATSTARAAASTSSGTAIPAGVTVRSGPSGSGYSSTPRPNTGRPRRATPSGGPDGRPLDPARPPGVHLVAGPVDLPAAGIGGDQERPGRALAAARGGVGPTYGTAGQHALGQRVQGAHPDHCRGKGQPEHACRGEADPQPGERARTHSDDDRVDLCEIRSPPRPARPRSVAPGTRRAGWRGSRCARPARTAVRASVVDRDSHRGGRGVERQQHASSPAAQPTEVGRLTASQRSP